MFTPHPIGRLGAEDVHEMFLYLDDLRDSGDPHMFGAAPFLALCFDLDPALSRRVLAEWMHTFGQRHGYTDTGERHASA